MEGDPIFDRISRGPRSARTPAFVTAREITPKSFGLLVRAVDKGVDRLATHCPQTAFVSRFQPTRDLLRRPSFRKTIADESPQFLIFFEYGTWLWRGTGEACRVSISAPTPASQIPMSTNTSKPRGSNT